MITRYVVGLGALAVLALALTWAFDPAYQTKRRNEVYLDYQRQALDLEAQRLDLARQQRQADQLEGINTLAQGLLTIALPVLLTIGTYVALDRYYRRRDYISADRRGLLPMHRDELRAEFAAAMLAAYHQTQAIAARYQVPVPHTYSPRIASGHPDQAQAVPAIPDPATALSVPTFADLLDQGKIGQGHPIILGFGTDGPITGTWLDLYSSAIGGLPGTGKTTTLRYLAGQSALHGARFVLLDPHAESGEQSLAGTLIPLAGNFLCAPASTPEGMLAALRLADDELERRLHDATTPAYPLVVIVDEFTAIMRGENRDLADQLARFLEKVAQEGRKKLVYALLSGQIWKATRSGGTELRASLASAFVHRMRREQARMLLPADEAPQAERLTPGEVILYRTSGETIVIRVPNTTDHDMKRVASLLTADAPTMPNLVASWKPNGSQMVATMEEGSTALESAKTASPEAARAAHLFLAGKDPAALVQELRGIGSSAGRKYQTALTEVMELVREGIRGTA